MLGNFATALGGGMTIMHMLFVGFEVV